MAILTERKETVDEQFGTPTMADDLIGGDDFFRREKAYRYGVGDFQLIVGYYSGIGRYAAFTKGMLGPQDFSAEDVQAFLGLIAPISQWKSSVIQSSAPGQAPAGGATASAGRSLAAGAAKPTASTPAQGSSPKPPTGQPAHGGTAKPPAADPPAHVIGSSGTDTTYQCIIKDEAKNDIQVLAWHRSNKGYVFAYCPLMPPPQPAIGASPAVIDPKFV